MGIIEDRLMTNYIEYNTIHMISKELRQLNKTLHKMVDNNNQAVLIVYKILELKKDLILIKNINSKLKGINQLKVNDNLNILKSIISDGDIEKEELIQTVISEDSNSRGSDN